MLGSNQTKLPAERILDQPHHIPINWSALVEGSYNIRVCFDGVFFARRKCQMPLLALTALKKNALKNVS